MFKQLKTQLKYYIKVQFVSLDVGRLVLSYWPGLSQNNA